MQKHLLQFEQVLKGARCNTREPVAIQMKCSVGTGHMQSGAEKTPECEEIARTHARTRHPHPGCTYCNAVMSTKVCAGILVSLLLSSWSVLWAHDVRSCCHANQIIQTCVRTHNKHRFPAMHMFLHNPKINNPTLHWSQDQICLKKKPLDSPNSPQNSNPEELFQGKTSSLMKWTKLTSADFSFEFSGVFSCTFFFSKMSFQMFERSLNPLHSPKEWKQYKGFREIWDLRDLRCLRKSSENKDFFPRASLILLPALHPISIHDQHNSTNMHKYKHSKKCAMIKAHDEESGRELTSTRAGPWNWSPQYSPAGCIADPVLCGHMHVQTVHICTLQ